MFRRILSLSVLILAVLTTAGSAQGTLPIMLHELIAELKRRMG